MSHIFRKYIRVKTDLRQTIDMDISELLHHKKTLAIHYRGTDFKKGWKKHPIALSPEDYYSAIDEALHLGAFEQIFLATDDNNALNTFKDRYKDKMIYYTDVYRSTDEIGVHFSQSERQYHKYKLGYEVLRDMLTLTSCDGLIAGLSQVAICTLITKNASSKKYEYIKILETGIHN